jgi:hypothetical protein
VDRRGPTGNTDWRSVNVEWSGLRDYEHRARARWRTTWSCIIFIRWRRIGGCLLRFCTVISHGSWKIAAKHEPVRDTIMGKRLCIRLRFELDDRPILSSRGIAEIAYTWEHGAETRNTTRRATGRRFRLATAAADYLRSVAER